MSLLRNCILPMALGLFLAPVALADDEKSSDASGQERTVRGVVSGVTVLGETDIDYATRKATTAEATYLTIIGHPSKQQESGKGGEQASSDKSRQKDTDVKQTANNAEKSPGNAEKGANNANVAEKSAGNTSNSEKGASGSGDRQRRRMNIYVVAVSPKTKVCEISGSGKDGSAGKEEACELEKLEIGDHVEVTFTPKSMPGVSEEKGVTQASSMKHGRHRTYFGIANSVKIREEAAAGEGSSYKGGEGSSSREKENK